jgi:capsular polysaccharide biosynthesis protein
VEEINLYDLLKYYAKNWLIILSAIFVGAIVGLVYTFFIQTPLYKSQATILVVGQRTTQDSTINNNYTELFKSRRVLDPVIGDKQYGGSYEQLLSNTTATNNKDTDVILVSIATTDAKKSQELLSASLDSFKKQADNLYSSNNIKVVDSASMPDSAYNVSILLQLGLSIVATVMITIIVLFFIYDYYSSQLKPIQKPKSNAKSKSKKTTSKKTSEKPSSSNISRSQKLLNIFFKKPMLAGSAVAHKQSTVNK